MNTHPSGKPEEDLKKEATDPFLKPLADMTEEEKLTQAMKAKIWIGVLSELFPQMNQQIRAGQNLKAHWERISFGVRLLEWDVAYRRSLGESTDIAEEAMQSLLQTKHIILEQIGN